MEKDRVQRYVRSLERTIQNNYHYLEKTMEDFQLMCQMVTPGRNVPTAIIIDIHQTYREIQNRSREVTAIQELLQRKYRPYYRRDSHLD
jgi:hypothetical protein